ncbi:hypothetical protein ABZP36_030920 [Zizania latifolia]
MHNLVMNVFAQCGELKAMWRLLEEMTDKGLTVSGRTFPLLVCTSGQGGLRWRLVERFIKSSYVAAGEFDEAQKFFDEMLVRGQLPNVYTYNSMICGLCTLGKFDKACSLLKDMDSHGCTPNFSVYSTLVSRLRS